MNRHFPSSSHPSKDTGLRHRTAWAALAATAFTAVAATLAAGFTPSAFAADKLQRSQVERGRYLVATGGCHDCHTPFKMGERGPEPDMARALSGHPEGMELPPPPKAGPGPWIGAVAATNTAWSGPWGVSFTANLTPDTDTGLGRWTLKDFKDTLRTGRHQGRGREILPPMPIPAYKNFNDRDIAAIYAYLRTVPAVKNRVPEPLPPAQ